jgi:purine nucleosidase
MTARIILDTDIGTDVDDCLALAVVLGSPELALEGVTCVYGDVDLRARMVRTLLRLRGAGGVPVLTGTRRPLLGKRPVYWAGHEGEGLLESGDDVRAPDREHAVDFIVRTDMDNPGQIYLLAIGPLTNVALALLREPALADRLAALTVMGGACRGPGSLHLAIAEHNIRCDPEAAHVVLSSGVPLTLVPLDVTTRVRIAPEGVARLRAAGTPFHAALAEQVERYPRYRERGHTYLHDPLAAAVMIEPGLVEWQELNVVVELAGEHTTGATLMRAPSDDAPANARVALEVDAPRAEAFMLERMARRAGETR